MSQLTDLLVRMCVAIEDAVKLDQQKYADTLAQRLRNEKHVVSPVPLVDVDNDSTPQAPQQTQAPPQTQDVPTVPIIERLYVFGGNGFRSLLKHEREMLIQEVLRAYWR